MISMQLLYHLINPASSFFVCVLGILEIGFGELLLRLASNHNLLDLCLLSS
jgi:hypothetical protein